MHGGAGIDSEGGRGAVENNLSVRATNRAVGERQTGTLASREPGGVVSRQAQSPRAEARGLGKA